MTHLLIPHVPSMDDGVEFRHSLRSLDANLHLDLDLTVVGHKPDWADFRHERHTAADPHAPKGHRMTEAVLAGLHRLASDGVSRALYMSDDYYLLYPQTAVANVHAGSLKVKWMQEHKSRPEHWWTRTLGNTMRYLDSRTADRLLCWEMHAPLWVEVDDAIGVLSEMQKHAEPLFWRTVYRNLCPPVEDSYQAQDGRWDSWRNVAGTPWATVDEQIWAKRGRTIAKRFPSPSRWES